ncbi:CatA-like O-acetyltransferase [Zongyangia hominis]|uniref:Chloramphenicol acetyltransferase n=1 Tax=Zongyangia hominis TaxID=2763677 RepID=A0A926EFN6_9FIRM|nr:CatA-like O-acetyltransferase [Zongyangia hominis]MBC8570822.1 chloramphenicol acetyltransferase [Zongyangia hominis]
MTNFRYLDMDAYPRKQHFAYFHSLAYPYVGVTANVKITALKAGAKEKGWPFFLTFCYCAANAANEVPEFRQRIEGDRIIEYDRCKTSHTVALDDGTYCYCTLDSSLPFHEYLTYAVRAQEDAKRAKRVEDDEDVRSLFFISSLPWLTYTSLVQPVPLPADTNPRITWGKFFKERGEIMMPVSVLCHHALVDGLHARFYEALDRQIQALCEEASV